MGKGSSKPGFYAVARGRTPGIYSSWDECEEQVSGYPGARYKKFNTRREAESFAGIRAPQASTSSFGVITKAPTFGSITMQLEKTKAHVVAKPSAFASQVDEDEFGYDVVYSDGSCRGNGQPGSVAGIGVWWGRDDPRNIAERCPGKQTNNRAELIAIIRVLEATSFSKKPLMIKTDSKYSIQCMTDWLPKWRENGFRSAKGDPISNRPLIEYLAALLALRIVRGQKVKLKHVRGHVGIEGNEGADRMANLGAGLRERPDDDWDVKRESVERFMEAQECGPVDEKPHRMVDKPVQVEIETDDEDSYWDGLDDIDLDALKEAEDPNIPSSHTSHRRTIVLPCSSKAKKDHFPPCPPYKETCDEYDGYDLDDILNADELEAELRVDQ